MNFCFFKKELSKTKEYLYLHSIMDSLLNTIISKNGDKKERKKVHYTRLAAIWSYTTKITVQLLLQRTPRGFLWPNGSKILFPAPKMNWIKTAKKTKMYRKDNWHCRTRCRIAIQLGEWLKVHASSAFWGGGEPASQPHTPPELCLCFALKAACSDAAFCRWSSSSSFCNVPIVWSFCPNSATSTYNLKDSS